MDTGTDTYTGTDIDWRALRTAALAAAERAYAPYSGFSVGCAALTSDGRIITGCNVENESYGLTLCAECVMIGELHLGGGGRLLAFDCIGIDRRAGSDATTITPCGRCRQLLAEAADPGMQLNTPAGLRTMAQLLPDAFARP